MNEKKYRYSERQKKYYKNLSKEKKLNNFYRAKNRLSDEYKFLESRYLLIKQRYKTNKHSIKNRNDMYTCDFTIEQFLNHWENDPCNKYKRNYSNVSVDRLDPDQPYTLKNIIFVRWDVNMSKGDLSIKHMKKILSLYKENFSK